MQWIAQTEKHIDAAALERRLWDAADQFRANSGLYSLLIEWLEGRIISPLKEVTA